MSTPTPPPVTGDYGPALGPLPPGFGPYVGNNSPPVLPPNTLGLAAFVTGLCGLVLTAALGMELIGGPIGLIMGPTAIVLGSVARKRTMRGEVRHDGFARTGSILGIITIVLAIPVTAFMVWITSYGF